MYQFSSEMKIRERNENVSHKRRRVIGGYVRQDVIFHATPAYAGVIFARTPRRCGAKKHLLAPNMFEKVYMDSSLVKLLY